MIGGRAAGAEFAAGAVDGAEIGAGAGRTDFSTSRRVRTKGKRAMDGAWESRLACVTSTSPMPFSGSPREPRRPCKSFIFASSCAW